MLPEVPSGDVTTEDHEIARMIMNLSENGDYDALLFDQDYAVYDNDVSEAGGPEKRDHVQRVAAKIAAKGRVSAKDARMIAKNPRGSRIVKAAAQAKRAASTAWLQYEFAEGCAILTSNLGLNQRLKPYMVEALKTHVNEFPLVQPRVIPITLVGGAGTIKIDQILSTVFGLSDGTLVKYVGIKLNFVASNLNRATGAEINVSRNLGSSSIQQTATVRVAEGKQVSSFSSINGGIVAGQPRYFAPTVSTSAAGTTNYDVTISNVPSGYTASARLLVPGDTEADRMFNLLG